MDPNFANLKSPPRNDRDLFVSAGNAHVLAYDNLSGLPPWLSDGSGANFDGRGGTPPESCTLIKMKC